jgi:hypothetical protein
MRTVQARAVDYNPRDWSGSLVRAVRNGCAGCLFAALALLALVAGLRGRR